MSGTLSVKVSGIFSGYSHHLIREWHGLPELPYLGRKLASIGDAPSLSYI